MNRNISVSVQLLSILENWLGNCWTCVRWDSSTSRFFQIKIGVRQDPVLSPYLFAMYLDDLVHHYSPGYSIGIILYADDILIIAPSACELQRLLTICDIELEWLDMSINVKNLAVFVLARDAMQFAPTLPPTMA